MGEIVAGGLLAIAGVVVASVLNHLTARASWWRDEALGAGADVAATYELIWGQSRATELEVHLMKLRVRLQALGVPEGDIALIDSTAKACWTDAHANLELAAEVGEDFMRGINTTLLDDFKRAVLAANVWLQPQTAPPHWLGGRFVTARRARQLRAPYLATTPGVHPSPDEKAIAV